MNDATYPIRLGQLDLTAHVGSGGTADVYSALTRDGSTVAVKVMRPALANVPRRRNAFFREIRSVARLNHPGIVKLVGLGQVTRDEAESSDGRLSAHTPFLVMEHVTGGTLPGASHGYDWTIVRLLILDLLDALAHAHASGVVHRDLKNANILLATDAAGESRVKLTDFGIARALDVDDPDDRRLLSDRVSGTPSTMAPEQAQGRWRDEGPWTDLYALGVVVWRLVCGRAPFEGETTEVLRAHIHEPLPDFQPRFAVPPRLEAWLRRMLAKHPRNRFRFAADAYHLFSLLPPATEDSRPPMVSGVDDDMPTLIESLRTSDLPTLTAVLPIMSSAPLPGEATAVMRTPVPESWGKDAPPPAAPMGLELFAMRSAPMMGRVDERADLWRAIVHADQGEPATLTVITGALGLGKSRLLDWLQLRATELGSANVLRAQFSEYPGPRDGLGPMVERYFHTFGLDRNDALDRVAQALVDRGLNSDDARATALILVDLIRPDDGVGLRHRAEREVFLAIGRVLDALAGERPVLVCLDDLHRSDEAARFVTQLRELGHRGVVIVATFDPASAARDGILAELEATNNIVLEPLPAESIRALVRSIVDVADGPLERLTAQANGSPAVAIDHAIMWTQEAEETGNSSSEATALSIDSVWRGTVRRICGAWTDRHSDARRLIWLAAVLGTTVDVDDWTAAARALGLESNRTLLETMVLEGLLHQRDGALQFRTANAAETLRKDARQTSDWRTLHRACATVLHRRYADSIAPEQLLRVARHAVEAEQWELAFEMLGRAALRTHNVSPEDANAVLELRRRTLERMNAPGEHEQYLWNDALEAGMAVYRGDTDDAIEILERIAKRAADEDLKSLLAYVCRDLAILLAPRDPVRAARVYDQSIATYEDLGERELAAITLCNSANLFAIMGQTENASGRVERARDNTAQMESIEASIEIAYQEGQLARLEGQLELARERFETAAEMASREGWTARAALALSDAGDVIRMLGDLEEAERVLRRVIQIADAMGQRQHVETIRMNLCLIASQRGDYEKAWNLAQQVAAVGLKGAVAHFVAAIALPAAAGTGRFDDLDALLAECQQLYATYGVTDSDLAWTAQRAAELAAEAGETERAVHAYEVAIAQFEALGRDEAETIRSALNELAS